jgi:hypothetical protein
MYRLSENSGSLNFLEPSRPAEGKLYLKPSGPAEGKLYLKPSGPAEEKLYLKKQGLRLWCGVFCHMIESSCDLL